jgi:hypothetical protein
VLPLGSPTSLATDSMGANEMGGLLAAGAATCAALEAGTARGCAC